MIGILSGLVNYAIQVGYSLVEALVLTLSFNYLAPILVNHYFIDLPFTHVNYWHVFAFILIVTILGYLINRLFPKIVNVENNSNNN